MSKAPLFLLSAAALCVTLGAPSQASRLNRGDETIHQPVVQRIDFVLDIAGSGLDPIEAGRVQQWFEAIGLGYGDRISVDTSAGGVGSNRDVALILGRYGLFLSDGAPATQGQIIPGQARIVVSRSTASVPGCPDFSRPSQPNFTGTTSSNFGCATSSMLAAMVANPADLVRGQEGNGSSAETAAKAIRVWRNADPSATKGLKIESTKAGN